MTDFNSNPLDNFNWDEFDKGQNSIETSQKNTGFDEEPVFKQGIAIVKRGGRYGAIMVGGKEIVPTIYDALTEFKDGLAEVEYKGEKRMLNLSSQIQVKRNNEYVFIPEKYDWGRDYNGDTCVVEKNGKYGLLSDNFHELVEPIYNSIVEINNNAYLAIGEHKGIILSVTPQFHYIVSDCLFSEKGIFLGAVVSLPGKDSLFGILDNKLQIVQPIENDSIVIKNNKFFVIQQKGKGVGICTLDGEIVPKGKYDEIEVLNEYFISAIIYNSEDYNNIITSASLLNDKGICLFTYSRFLFNFTNPFSLTCDGYVEFLNQYGYQFKISPYGEIYFVLYLNNINKKERIGQYSVSLDLVRYEYIEPFNNDCFIVGEVNENGLIRFGVVNSKGVTILPIEYSRLKILSKDFIAYSCDDENILDLKELHKEEDLRWLLHNTDYGRFGEILNVLYFGILNSEYKKICPQKYRNIKVVETSSAFFFPVSVDGNKWGIIDITDKIVLPIKYDSIDFTNASYPEFDVIKMENLSGVAYYGPSRDSERKKNVFDENGMFVIPLPDGKRFMISSSKYDWCDNFDDSGWAKVIKSGLNGRINIKGELISMFGDTSIVVPDIYDWAYDFRFDYAPVYKDGKWGIADKNWAQIIPCVYEFIEPVGEGFFKYKETANTTSSDDNKRKESVYNQNSQYVYGIVNIESVEIVKANYKDIWLLEEGYFKVERPVDNIVKERDRYGIINNNGNLLVPPCYSEIVLVNKEGKDFWIVSQNYKKGVFLNKDLIIPAIYHSIVFVGESIDCVLSNCGHRKTIKYNLNGEVVVIYCGTTITIPQEYIIALESSIGLFRVKDIEGKWGILNCKKEIVVPPKYDFIGEFERGYAIVGIGDFVSCLNEKSELFRANVKYGLIDVKGEEVVPLENDDIILYDNGYVGFKKDGVWGLMSASLSLVVAPAFSSMYLFDNWHFVIGNDNSEKGLIDCSGNTIIPFQYFDNIEISEDGYYKVTFNGYLQSRCKLYSAQGKVVLGNDDSYEEITYKGNGLNLVRKSEWYDSRDDAYYHVYNLCYVNGKEVLPYFVKDVTILDNGYLSIRDKGWGMADITGKILIEPNYENELVFENGVSPIKVRNSSYTHKINFAGDVLISDKEKNICLPLEFYWGTEFVNGLSIVRSKKEKYKVGVVNDKGNLVLSARFDKINIMSDKTIVVVDEGCYGIANRKGQFFFPPIFHSIKYLSDNRIIVKWNIMIAKSWNNDGSFITGDGDQSKSYHYPQEYDRVALCDNHGNVLNDKSIVFINKFENGYAKAYKDIFVDEYGRVRLSQAGIVDMDGKIVLEPRYKRIDFHNQSYALAKDNHYSIFRLTDKKLTCFKGKKINHIWTINSLGIAEYTSTGKYNSEDSSWDGDRGVLGIEGIIVPAGKYDYVEILNSGIILVAKEPIVFTYEVYIDLYDDDDYEKETRQFQWYKKWGLISYNGDVIAPCIYSYYSELSDDKIILCKGGDVCLDKYGPNVEAKGGEWSVFDVNEGKLIKVHSREEGICYKTKNVSETDNTHKDDRDKLDFEPPHVLLSDSIKKPKSHSNYTDYRYDDEYDDDKGSCSKYGGYNGWDDNTIDEAFDGNPELTWNID